MNNEKIIAIIDSLPVIKKAENEWDGYKHHPVTFNLIDKDKLLSALRSEDEKQKNDPNLCCVCHKNYVDSADGFDTCQSCINNI